MKYDVHDDEEYIRLAFRRLESEFEDPNDFELDAFAVHTQDTIYDLLPYKAYNVYFTYFLNKDKEKKFFSKLVVVKDNVSLLLYNADTRTNEEYIDKKEEWKKREAETFESIHKSFREMPDSVRNAIIDTLREILKP